MNLEFKAFDKIEQLKKVSMHITQKIHGTNAQVFIYTKEDGTLDLICGSRTRWIYPDNDNYGFANFVNTNKEAFLKLGPGHHFGEWCGPGINSGEGLTEKYFILFDFWKLPPERELPPQCKTVPVLYQGAFDLNAIDLTMTELQTTGSKLVPGFMRPEGVVVMTMGQRFKKTFKQEETAWKKACPIKAEKESQYENTDVSHLLQPIRMEKLLSKDEAYIREYPKSLPKICSDYFQDLLSEGQIEGDEYQIKAIRKNLGSQLFSFAKEMVDKQGNINE